MAISTTIKMITIHSSRLRMGERASEGVFGIVLWRIRVIPDTEARDVPGVVRVEVIPQHIKHLLKNAKP